MQNAATPQVQEPAAPAVRATTSSLLQAFAALGLGLLVVGMAGFSHLEVVHNASHDTRHSNGFPCH